MDSWLYNHMWTTAIRTTPARANPTQLGKFHTPGSSRVGRKRCTRMVDILKTRFGFNLRRKALNNNNKSNITESRWTTYLLWCSQRAEIWRAMVSHYYMNCVQHILLFSLVKLLSQFSANVNNCSMASQNIRFCLLANPRVECWLLMTHITQPFLSPVLGREFNVLLLLLYFSAALNHCWARDNKLSFYMLCHKPNYSRRGRTKTDWCH